MKDVVVAITGGSGAAYARRLVDVLADKLDRVHLVVSRHGAQVASMELGVNLNASDFSVVEFLGRRADAVTVHHYRDMAAPIASGSNTVEAMVVVPCSMRTLGCIAGGCGDNLIHRAADVMLKEQRPLILVPRETPLSAIHLENMLRLARAGACVMPAAPAFYHNPQCIDDLVDFLAGRILSRLGIRSDLLEPWPPAGESEG
ncbi:MAG: UbiX family flavin prenyltransferase [Planctomycetes bacterium]|nr:UbiX family flavin prenyltransferase [Planctomycetota bacterium]